MLKSALAIGTAVLVAASTSGGDQQAVPPIAVGMPAPYFGTAQSGAFSAEGLRKRERLLGPEAPAWADRMYRRSVRVLVALTDPRTGAMIAGERDGWNYVWPRDASFVAAARCAVGQYYEALKVLKFLDTVRPLAGRWNARYTP